MTAKFNLTIYREKVSANCPAPGCGQLVEDCMRKEIPGQVRLIEITRVRFGTNIKSQASIDLSNFNVLSCVLHLPLRKS